jgi:hypothetical protein
MLAPAGAMIMGGVGAIVVIFVAWQFIIPFFFERAQSNAPTPAPIVNEAVKTPSANLQTSPAPQVTQANSTAQAVKPFITGKVIDAVDRVPVSKAKIQVNNKSVETDPTGSFAFTEALPVAPLVVNAPGYQPLTWFGFDNPIALELKPVTLSGKLLETTSQKPLANVSFTYNSQTVSTDSDGKFTLKRVIDGDSVAFVPAGYEKVEFTIDTTKSEALTLTTKANKVEGVLLDAQSGKPVKNAIVSIGDKRVEADKEGKFTVLNPPSDGSLKVRAPGYKIQTFSTADAAKGLKLVPFTFRGIYVPGLFTTRELYDKQMPDYWKMAEQGLINAIIVDIKWDANGKLFFDSQIPLAKELNLYYDPAKKNLTDFKRLLADAKKVNLYVVARYVVYRDPAIATAKPDWAIKSKKTGKSWLDTSNLPWPNQFNDAIGDYNFELAKEVSKMGFDEIQFDYIRFPSDGDLNDIDFGNGKDWKSISGATNEKLRTDQIEKVVKKTHDYLKTTDVFFSLDVFGYSLWLADDVGIGQQYNNLVKMSDYICPMVYPSHFDPNTMNFPNPGLKPFEIMQQSSKLSAQLESKIETYARYRPWLEAFPKNYGAKALQYKHTPERIKAQIDGVFSVPTASGWTLWNVAGNYDDSVGGMPKLKP